MQDALIIQQPPAAVAGDGSELLLLFHGVGATAHDMLPLGQALAAQRPSAWVVSVRSPDPSDFGTGWQWFSVQGITEAGRPARVQATLPRFLQTVAHWQDRANANASTTTLIGFSQGAIMALEATQVPAPPAHRVVAIAGRFAQPPQLAPPDTALHLMHGEADPVMPVALAEQAAERLQQLGATVTLDRFAQLGHGIDARVLARIQHRLWAMPAGRAA
jgi:phospholipase/carboxylesterase